MSNFIQPAIHPKTGKYEAAAMLDDCFGRHNYGVLFKDGSLYESKDVEIPGEAKAEWDDFNTAKAYDEGKRIINARK